MLQFYSSNIVPQMCDGFIASWGRSAVVIYIIVLWTKQPDKHCIIP
jgi:hypothetical protein